MASFTLNELKEVVISLRNVFPGLKSHDLIKRIEQSEEEIAKLETERETASFLAKRGINKQIEKLLKDIESNKNQLLTTVLEEYKDIWNELIDNIKKIALIIPEKTRVIQTLDPPAGPQYDSVLLFAKKVSNAYTDLTSVLKDEIVAVLNSNRETLEKYRHYVEVNEEKVPTTSRTTVELLELSKLVELLDMKAQLQDEKNYLDNRKNEVERKAILNLAFKNSTLSKNIETAQSLSVVVPDTLSEGLNEVLAESEGETTFSRTFMLEKKVDKLTLEFLTLLRTELISIKNNTENQVGRVQTISGLASVTVDEPPEINVSSMDALELCRHIESLRSWQQKVLYNIKKVLDVQDFKTTVRKCTQKDIEIPEPLVAKVTKELVTTMDKTSDLDEAVNVLKEYAGIKSQVAEIIRRRLLSIVQNEELIPIIEVFDAPPSINLETNDPEVLLKQHDAVQNWEKMVSSYLQGLTEDVTAIIEHVNKISKMMSINPGFKEKLTALNKKIAGEQNVNILLGHRKEIIGIRGQILESCNQYIERSLGNEELMRIVALTKAPTPPAVTGYNTSKFNEVIKKLEEIKEWKNELINHLRNTKDIDQAIVLAENSQLYGVELPPDFFTSLKSLKEKIREQSTDIQPLSELNIEKDRLFSAFQQQIRDRVRSVIKTHESLQLDTGDLHAISLEGDTKMLMSSLETVYKWMDSQKSTLINEIKDAKSLLGQYKNVEKLGVDIPEMMKRNLDSIAQAILDYTESDVISLAQRLMGMNEIKEKLTILTEQQIQQEKENIRQLISVLNSVPSQLSVSLPGFMEEQFNIIIRAGELDQATALLKGLIDWKSNLAQGIMSTVHGLEIMLLPMETDYDLRRQRQNLLDEMKKIKEPEVIVVKYVNFLSKLERTREEILQEIKKLRTDNRINAERIKKLAASGIRAFMDFQLTVPVDRQIDEYNYSHVLHEWWELNKGTMRDTERLTEIVEKEVFSIAEDFNFPVPHSEQFVDIVKFLMESYNRIKEKATIGEILDEFDRVKKEAVDLAQFCYDKFSRGISSALTVAVPRMSEVTELPFEVVSKAQAIQSRFGTFSDLTRMSHSVREIIHDYEELTAELLKIVKDKSKEVADTIKSLKKESEVDLSGQVPKKVIETAELPKNTKMTLNEVSDVFSAVDTFKANARVNDVLREKCRDYVKEIQQSVDLVSNLYSFDLRENLKTFFEFLDQFDVEVKQNNFFALTDLALSLVQIRNDVSEAIKNIEMARHERKEEELFEKNRYYASIKEMFNVYTPVLSKTVFPYDQFTGLRERLINSKSLGEMIEILPKIEKEREKWLETVEQVNTWYKALIMFISDYHKSSSKEENIRQFEEIRKKVYDTYSNTKIRTYFILIVKYFIELQSGQTFTIKEESA
ncbi:MAG: hypothetical protein ACFFD4_02890 [Candidatus Odinarchaeota archaeon]